MRSVLSCSGSAPRRRWSGSRRTSLEVDGNANHHAVGVADGSFRGQKFQVVAEKLARLAAQSAINRRRDCAGMACPAVPPVIATGRAVELVRSSCRSSQARNSASVMGLRSATFMPASTTIPAPATRRAPVVWWRSTSGEAAAWRGNVSGARHRHVVGQGAAGRRRSAHRRRGERALDVSRPQPLWSEQNPDDWVEGVEAAVHTVRRHAPEASRSWPASACPARCTARPSSTPPASRLRPAILWNDGRCFAECEELTRRVPDFLARAGNLAMPGFTAPKAMWLAKHEPDAFAATKRVLLPKDYVRLKLTGEAVSDMSDAAGTLWLDIAARRWDDTLLAATGLTLAHMPRAGRGLRGLRLSLARVAAAWGLGGRKIPVAGGGGDNAASAVGVGAVAAGRGFRLARHVGRGVLRHRQIRQPAASARCTPSATRCPAAGTACR